METRNRKLRKINHKECKKSYCLKETSNGPWEGKAQRHQRKCNQKGNRGQRYERTWFEKSNDKNAHFSKFPTTKRPGIYYTMLRYLPNYGNREADTSF